MNTALTKPKTPDERLAALARSASNILLLKYNSGNWTIGDVPVPPDTRFVCYPDQTAHAWTHFEAGEWVSEISAIIIEDEEGDAELRIVKGQGREDLGDLDESLWGVDKSGKKKDPWSYGFALPMVNAATGATVVYKASSAGGKAAIGERVGDFQRNRHLGYPIVTLSTGSYKNKRYGGFTNIPILRVVGYDTPPAPAAASGGNGNGARVVGTSKARNSDMDDDIPW